MTFVWDEAKRQSNLAKHGLDFVDVPLVFGSPVFERLDDRHDYGEDRWIAIGVLLNRAVVVVYVEQLADARRVISFRKATRDEQRRYAAYLADRLGAG